MACGCEKDVPLFFDLELFFSPAMGLEKGAALF